MINQLNWTKLSSQLIQDRISCGVYNLICNSSSAREFALTERLEVGETFGKDFSVSNGSPQSFSGFWSIFDLFCVITNITFQILFLQPCLLMVGKLGNVMIQSDSYVCKYSIIPTIPKVQYYIRCQGVRRWQVDSVVFVGSQIITPCSMAFNAKRVREKNTWKKETTICIICGVFS